MIPYPGTAASRIRSRSGRPVNYPALRRSPAGVRSLRAGRSHRGFGPAPVHGRGATFVAVASFCPNSAHRVATPPWTDSGGLRHSRFNCQCPRHSPGIRGRVMCAPPRQDVCLPRLARLVMSSFVKRCGLEPVASTTHTENLHSCRLAPPRLACASAGGRKHCTP